MTQLRVLRAAVLAERVGVNASGAWLWPGEAERVLFVDRGRICLATDREHRRKLARQLGDSWSPRGGAVVSTDERQTLLAITVGTLAASESTHARWQPHTRDGYAARHRFSAAELLDGTALLDNTALLDGAEGPLASVEGGAVIDALMPSGGPALAFDISNRAYVASRGARHFDAVTLERLCLLARRCPTPAEATSVDDTLLACAVGDLLVLAPTEAAPLQHRLAKTALQAAARRCALRSGTWTRRGIQEPGSPGLECIRA